MYFPQFRAAASRFPPLADLSYWGVSKRPSQAATNSDKVLGSANGGRPASSSDQSEPAAAGGPVPDFSKDQDLSAYETMLTIRRFEEKAGQMYGMGLIGGFCHLYIGQEAVVVGMQMALKQGDQVITGYRDHGHMIACGMDPKGVMAELTGRTHGYSKGKGGSMHMFSVDKGFFARPRYRRCAGAARHGARFRQPLSRQ